MNTFFDFIISLFLVVLVLAGPLSIYALIQILNSSLGGLKASFVRTSLTTEAPLGLLVTWDDSSFPLEICRIRAEYSELMRGGRSTAFSFTFEDKDAKKRSFLLPMKLEGSDLSMLTDRGPAGARKPIENSVLTLEVENTKGETIRKKIAKAEILQAFQSGPSDAAREVEVLPSKTPDSWSVLTRVFPWRKAAAAAAVAATAAPAVHGEKPKAKAPSAPSLVDFLVTKVWIEPGCIVCDACENEAPDVFKVLADTCIVKENAPLDNGGSIKAAAEGCPVNVIKYTTVPKPA